MSDAPKDDRAVYRFPIVSRTEPKPPAAAPPAPPPTAPPVAQVKHGLYSLGQSDVIMSLPLFNVILRALEDPDPVRRAELVVRLKQLFDAPFI